MQTTRVHELVDKGYKDNGLLDRIIFRISLRRRKYQTGRLTKISQLHRLRSILPCGKM